MCFSCTTKRPSVSNRDLATMVRTPDEGCLVHVISFICDVSIGIEVPDLISFLSSTGWVILPLDLSVFVEDIHEFLAELWCVPFTYSPGRLDTERSPSYKMGSVY